MNRSDFFTLATEQGSLVITPLLDMGEFNCDQIKEAGAALVAQVDQAPEKNLIIDFSQTDYFGSDALGLFVHLWRKAERRGGRIAFCGASELGDEILRRAKFDHFGLICPDRAAAHQAFQPAA